MHKTRTHQVEMDGTVNQQLQEREREIGNIHECFSVCVQLAVSVEEYNIHRSQPSQIWRDSHDLWPYVPLSRFTTLYPAFRIL